MPYTIKVTNVEPMRHQATGTDFLDVTVDIKDGETVLATRKLGFDPSISEQELGDELAKYLDGYTLEQEQAAARVDQDAAEANMGELRDKFVGLEIGPAALEDESA